MIKFYKRYFSSTRTTSEKAQLKAGSNTEKAENNRPTDPLTGQAEPFDVSRVHYWVF